METMLALFQRHRRNSLLCVLSVYIKVHASNKEPTANNVADGGGNEILANEVTKVVISDGRISALAIHQAGQDKVHVGDTMLVSNGGKRHDGPPHAKNLPLKCVR